MSRDLPIVRYTMCHVAPPQQHADLKRSHSDPALAGVTEEEEEEEGGIAERRYPGMCVVCNLHSLPQNGLKPSLMHK